MLTARPLISRGSAVELLTSLISPLKMRFNYVNIRFNLQFILVAARFRFLSHRKMSFRFSEFNWILKKGRNDLTVVAITLLSFTLYKY